MSRRVVVTVAMGGTVGGTAAAACSGG